MAASVESTFRLIDRASGTLDKIERKARAMDTALRSAGEALDSVGSRKAETDLGRLGTKLDDTGRKSQQTQVRFRMSMQQLERNVANATRSATTDLERVQAALEYLDKTRANPRIELEGGAEAIAMTRLLRSELNKLQREQAKTTLGGMGMLGASGAGSGGGFLSKGLGWLANVPGLFIQKWGVMLGLFTAAIPVIESAVGVVGALGSVLGTATVGAGALGIGGLTGFVTALGLVVPAVKSVTTEIGEAKSAWDAYNQAVEESGRNSREAHKALRAFEGTGRAGDLVRQASAFSDRYKGMTRPARDSVYSIMENSLKRMNDKWLPSIARWTNRIFTGGKRRGGIEAGVDQMFDVLERPQFRKSMDRVVDMMTEASPIAGRTLGHLATVFANIAAAAKPAVLDVLKRTQDMVEGWSKGTSNLKETREGVNGFYDDLNRVWRLLRESSKLIGAFFGAGRGTGQSLVKDMTEQMRDWRKTIEENPQQLENWFDTMARRFGKFLDTLGQIVRAFRTLNELLAPLLERLADLANMDFGGISGMEALTAYGLYRYGKGKFRGRTPSGGVPRTGAPVPGGSAPRSGPVVLGPNGKPLPPSGKTAPLPPNPTSRGAGGLMSRVPGLRGAGAAVRRVPVLTALFAASGFMNPQGPYKDTGIAGRGASALEAADPTRLAGLLFPDSKLARQGLAATIFRPLAKAVGPGLSASSSEILAGFSEYGGLGSRRTFDLAKRKGIPIQGLESMDQIESELGFAKMFQDKGVPMSQLPQTLKDFGFKIDDEDIQPAVDVLKELNRLTALHEKQRERLDRLGNKGFDIARMVSKQKRPMGESVLGILDEVKKIPKGAREEAANTAVGMAKVLERKGKLPEGTAKTLRQVMTHEFGQMKIDSVQHSAEMAQGVIATQQALADAVHGAMKFIHDVTNEGLQSVGAKALSWGISHPGKVGAAVGGALNNPLGTLGSLAAKGASALAGGGKKGAGGMRIYGRGLQDTVPVAPGHLAAPGELIVNRHTEDRINNFLNPFGTSLGREVEGETRPHSSSRKRIVEHNASLGGMLKKFAKGGRGGTRSFANIVELGRWIQSLAPYYTVGENPAFGGVQGGHATNSYHYKGQAIDVNADAAPGGEMGALDSLYKKLQPLGLTELLWRVADHYDHLHAAMAGPASGSVSGIGKQGGGMSIPLIGNLALKGPNTPQSQVAQGAIDKVKKAANDKLSKLGGLGASGAMMKGSGAAKGGLTAWLTKALKITGQFSPANLVALRGRAMQESGGDPRAQNNWDSNAAAGTPSMGLLQTIMPTFQAYAMKGMNNIWNPVDNAVAAIRYMMARYGHIVGPSSSGYARGGRLPGFGGWFGRGGSFKTGVPMLFGAGDGAGEEQVDIRPGRSSSAGRGGGGAGVVIHNITVQNHRSGDIRKQIEKEVGEAFDNLSRKLETQGEVDSEEMMV